MIRNSILRSLSLVHRVSAPPATTSLMSKRTVMGVRDHLYYNRATASGPGRNGPVTSAGDSPLELNFNRPKTIGGKGSGQTPEQLLAMGYSSCFLSALQFAASKANKVDLVRDAKVHTTVYFGPPEEQGADGFNLSVDVVVEGVDDDEIILAADELSPFSRALEPGVKINLRKMPHEEEENSETLKSD